MTRTSLNLFSWVIAFGFLFSTSLPYNDRTSWKDSCSCDGTNNKHNGNHMQKIAGVCSGMIFFLCTPAKTVRCLGDSSWNWEESISQKKFQSRPPPESGLASSPQVGSLYAYWQPYRMAGGGTETVMEGNLRPTSHISQHPLQEPLHLVLGHSSIIIHYQVSFSVNLQNKIVIGICNQHDCVGQVLSESHLRS